MAVAALAAKANGAAIPATIAARATAAPAPVGLAGTKPCNRCTASAFASRECNGLRECILYLYLYLYVLFDELLKKRTFLNFLLLLND